MGSFGKNINENGGIELLMHTDRDKPTSRNLFIREAARMVGVHPDTLRRWERRGKLAVHRNPMNNYRLYRIEDLEEVVRTTRA